MIFRSYTGEFLKPHFPGFHYPPIREVNVDGKRFELSLWDTTAQDEFDRLRPLFYPSTDAFLLCFAIDQPTSLENVRSKWLPEMLHHRTSQTVPYLLVGLRSDLREDSPTVDSPYSTNLEAVTEGIGEDTARLIGAEAYIECSALTGEGVEK
ncbi:hypothetical protein FRC17_003547, partial [Serendipita sp. 399]